MRQLIDREQELRRLREQREQAPSLVVMRGRRRVGKTFLLAHAFAGEGTISYQADEQPRAAQLAAFAAEAARLLPGAPPLRFHSWDAALSFIGTEAAGRTAAQALTVVIDELQYAFASDPALPSVLQRHWDRWERDGTRICLVLSGSALSFMEGLLSRSAPLHGRATYRPAIEPLDYRDAARFAPQSSPEAAIERYAVLGGTPQYQLWAGARSLQQVVTQQIMCKGAPLYEEPLTLIRQEEGIRDPKRYFGALSAIASGRTKNAEIGGLLEMPSSNVAVVLDRLMTLGYVREVLPVMAKGARRRGFWQVSDPFFRFWFRWIAPNRSRLEQGRGVNAVWAEIASDLDTYVGRIFEEVCRQWLARHSSLDAARSAKEIGSWWSRDGQQEIDIACAEDDRYTLLGSCKWSRRLVGEDALHALARSRDAIEGRSANAQLAIFARRGFTERLRAAAAQEDVLLVTAADLFAAS